MPDQAEHLTTDATPLERALLAASRHLALDATLDELRATGIVNRMAQQIDSRTFRIESLPSPEDLKGFLFALLALRTICACESNDDRDGAVRLLRAAANEVELYGFPERAEPPAKVRDRLERYFSQRSPMLTPPQLSKCSAHAPSSPSA